ncbi:DUF2793 domain-containing protein [Parvibaculum sp.]|uniref:DUF2793 domain-containing protein n=1 Tax=Parvibaculum sp. TaxID=2024848 RepID=UPI003BA85668
MSDTFHLELPFLEASQAQKHVTVNETLRRLDALLHLSVVSRLTGPLPEEPAEGARYITEEGEVAAFIDGAWVHFTPKPGWRAWNEATEMLLVHDGYGWMVPSGGGPALLGSSGAETRLTIVQGEHEVGTGASSDTSFLIPDRAIVLGVTGIVTEAITGAASWKLGVADDAARYGNTIGIAEGSTVVGPSGMPTAYYGATAIRVTAEGGDFTGGKVRLAIHCLEMTGPTA